MSNIVIKRAVSNITEKTSIFTPIVEAVVNSIQAIQAGTEKNGLIQITLKRNRQLDLEGTQSSRGIEEIRIEDNGVGFNNENQESFDTLYSELKIADGGKGFGRLTYLKYFDHVWVESTYKASDSSYLDLSFKMGDEKHFIVERNLTASNSNRARTTVRLSGLKKKSAINQSAKQIARNLVELLLPYFITDEYECPKIVLMEEDGSELITLNEYLSSEQAVIQEVFLPQSDFKIAAGPETHNFKIRTFKIYSPGSKVSKVSLVADKREVETAFLSRYIPEFEDEFFDPAPADNSFVARNFILKTYVFGRYLDENVSLERGGFRFRKERLEDPTLYEEVCQTDIEKEAARLTAIAFQGELSSRSERKKIIISDYVDNNAPWHRETLNQVDLNEFSMHPKPEEIEAVLHKQQFKAETLLRARIKNILKEDQPSNLNEESASSIAKNITEKSKSELIHYVVLRKYLLDLLERRLEYKDDNRHYTEGAVHDIIFPRKKDTDTISYDEHNLWILDERLSFTNYVSSDIPLDGIRSDRGDVVVYGNRIAMRGENISTNPITIFEFKRPGRDDFADPSSDEDPIAQIVRYANKIRDKKFRTPPGRPMEVTSTTPFYGYVVCDFTPKVEEWLEREKSFTPMPDRKGWFSYLAGPKIYIEVLSWDKVLRDAVIRNKVFFYKLGIDN